MKIENLTLTNFNGREFNVTYYSLQDNPQLLLKKKTTNVGLSRW